MLREEAKRELENVLRELGAAYDVFEAAQRAIVGIVKRSRDRRTQNERHRRLREAGSCQTCGAEAQKERSRCLDCGKKAAACAKQRATQRQGPGDKGERTT